MFKNRFFGFSLLAFCFIGSSVCACSPQITIRPEPISGPTLADLSKEAQAPEEPMSIPEPKDIGVDSVSFQDKSFVLEDGQEYLLKASALLSDGTSSPDLIWLTSDSRAVSVSNTGKIRRLSPGEVTITAIAKADNSKKAELLIQTPKIAPTPTPDPELRSDIVKELKVTSPLTVSLGVDETHQIQAVAIMEDGSEKIVEYNVSDSSLLNVNGLGIARRIQPGAVSVLVRSPLDVSKWVRIDFTDK